jgi:hypothetical protein
LILVGMESLALTRGTGLPPAAAPGETGSRER